MVRKEINVLIWDEVEERAIDENVRNFLKEVLVFEREHIGEERPRYTDEFDKLIEKHSKIKTGDHNEDL